MHPDGVPRHNVPLTIIKGQNKGSDPVYEFTLEGQKFIFRDINEYRDPRLILAASDINQHFALNNVPRARVAYVEGRLGVVSDFVEGIKLPADNQKKKINDLIAGGKLDSRSYADAQAFEFLVGNNDADSRNVVIDAKGQVHCFDHNYALTRGIPEYVTGQFSLGPVLPDKYTPTLAKKIKALALDANDPKPRAAFITRLKKNLSNAEIDALLFRLEIINQDLIRRGPDALFTE